MTNKKTFKLQTSFSPEGDQPKAIKKLTSLVKTKGIQTLLGVTGSGKTFTIANVIAQTNKSTLVIAPNKTLAAQLFTELKGFFPNNAVHYFVSYYDYYQPESYIPTTDTYIEKDASINEKIDQMRLAATAALMSDDPVIIVASVSCIYGLGSPKHYKEMSLNLHIGDRISRQDLLSKLVDIHYERNDTQLSPRKFRVRGDVIDIQAPYLESTIRIELFGDTVESIKEIDPLTGKSQQDLDSVIVFPAKHFVSPDKEKQEAMKSIQKELDEVLPTLNELERQRLKSRTDYDLEMINELGYCSGVENYSRHFDQRVAGEPASCLIDFFSDDFLLVIDESHLTIPQLNGMYKGDRSRKKNLIDNGFRLPSAYDNRPLKFNEFKKYMTNTIFVSATPSEYELKNSKQIVEQIIRPTGLLDPEVIIRPSKGQIDDLIEEINKTTKNGFRTLVTTLTKKMSEDLTDYLTKAGLKVRYLHSEIKTFERTEILNSLRIGEFNCLIGINLLREGLDLPEVALVAILDADKEGFLRNTRSLIQTIGRASRNSESKVIMYADKKTNSIIQTINETARRRKIQTEFNKKYGITPTTIIKSTDKSAKQKEETLIAMVKKEKLTSMNAQELKDLKMNIEFEMNLAADNLDFEHAIELKDALNEIKKINFK